MTDKANTQDIRWLQRFSNYKKALTQLTAFVTKGHLSILEYQGESTLQGSRDTIRLAFKQGLIKEGEVWMDMVESRIQTAHTY